MEMSLMEPSPSWMMMTFLMEVQYTNSCRSLAHCRVSDTFGCANSEIEGFTGRAGHAYGTPVTVRSNAYCIVMDANGKSPPVKEGLAGRPGDVPSILILNRAFALCIVRFYYEDCPPDVEGLAGSPGAMTGIPFTKGNDPPDDDGLTGRPGATPYAPATNQTSAPRLVLANTGNVPPDDEGLKGSPGPPHCTLIIRWAKASCIVLANDQSARPDAAGRARRPSLLFPNCHLCLWTTHCIRSGNGRTGFAGYTNKKDSLEDIVTTLHTCTQSHLVNYADFHAHTAVKAPAASLLATQFQRYTNQKTSRTTSSLMTTIFRGTAQSLRGPRLTIVSLYQLEHPKHHQRRDSVISKAHSQPNDHHESPYNHIQPKKAYCKSTDSPSIFSENPKYRRHAQMASLHILKQQRQPNFSHQRPAQPKHHQRKDLTSTANTSHYKLVPPKHRQQEDPSITQAQFHIIALQYFIMMPEVACNLWLHFSRQIYRERHPRRGSMLYTDGQDMDTQQGITGTKRTPRGGDTAIETVLIALVF